MMLARVGLFQWIKTYGAALLEDQQTDPVIYLTLVLSATTSMTTHHISDLNDILFIATTVAHTK